MDLDTIEHRNTRHGQEPIVSCSVSIVISLIDMKASTGADIKGASEIYIPIPCNFLSCHKDPSTRIFINPNIYTCARGSCSIHLICIWIHSLQRQRSHRVGFQSRPIGHRHFMVRHERKHITKLEQTPCLVGIPGSYDRRLHITIVNAWAVQRIIDCKRDVRS